MADLPRRLVAEALATALLLATVVGSGIMAARLSGGNDGIALLANALATGAMLPVLILVFGPLSGAAMNPAVTAVLAMRREIPGRIALAHAGAQVAGALAGVVLAHAMFELPLVQAGTTARAGAGAWIAEAVATAGLVLTILGVRRARPEALPHAVGLYITAAYWFTASTSFANPAVTLARAMTDSFAGIAPADVAGFVLAQMAGAIGAAALWRWLAETRPSAA
ncbi:aquaporin [Falsiroseomonas ponticola]|uniref:aquaporin n=1 Tax=Falsiroseomonas ponticola TaxID=2786951 RepID=UPI0019342580|nr:MIP/aquaporin family protein [Roseomonas ponticola]